MLITALYPLLKRITHWPQVGIGVAFSWGIPMAFAAQTGAVPASAWLLFAGAVLWPMAYDTFYAMVDRDDDLLIGVKSTAILFGSWDRATTALLQLSMIAIFVVYGRLMAFHSAYYLGLAAAATLMAYQQVLIKDRQRERCLKAFIHNHWVGLVIFVGLFANFMQ